MPELPEVETTRRGISPHVSGLVVTGVRVRNARFRVPIPEDLAGHVVGQRLLNVRRRAKYLLLDFPHGCVIVHLGMSGSLRVVAGDPLPGPHDHVDLVFDSKMLRLRDPRRFGLVLWHGGDPFEHRLLASLGREPLDEGFTGAWLHGALRGLRTPIKQALMDAHRVVGIGNIYASESLFRARIHPLAPAGEIGPRRCELLVASVRDTLEKAIEAGGSTLRDFVGGDGKAGYFQQQYFAYGRDGEACRVCAHPIERAVMGQRSTFFCPHCQRR